MLAKRQRERVMERARAVVDLMIPLIPTSGGYQANKAVADAEARKQARDRGADEKQSVAQLPLRIAEVILLDKVATDQMRTTKTSGPQKEDDGPSNDKVICTAMHEMAGFGSYRNKVWQTYAKQAYRNDNVQLGYTQSICQYGKNICIISLLLAKVLGYFAQ